MPDLSDPEYEDLEAVPEAPSLQMVPWLMGVAGHWWRPLGPVFVSIFLVVCRGKGKAHEQLLAGGSAAAACPYIHGRICSILKPDSLRRSTPPYSDPELLSSVLDEDTAMCRGQLLLQAAQQQSISS